MLAWGSVVWLPTVYTLQTQFLARYPVRLSPLGATIILLIGFGGYMLFRSANHQKNLVRRTNGQCKIWGAKAECVRFPFQTQDGQTHESLLLCSGKTSKPTETRSADSFRLVGGRASCELCGRSHLGVCHVRGLWYHPPAAMDVCCVHDYIANPSMLSRRREMFGEVRSGLENLLGEGSMEFDPWNLLNIDRLHGVRAFNSQSEADCVDFLVIQRAYQYQPDDNLGRFELKLAIPARFNRQQMTSPLVSSAEIRHDSFLL